jgi:8-oxo-dGTP pyrophosphatase MutT (NUDIX family)
VAARRQCSRVLLVDEQERVLLFSGIDRTRPEVPQWWFPVGGALEPNETHTRAAIRETREETGLTMTDPAPLCLSPVLWEFEGQEYDQEEWFFVVRTPTFEPTSSEWTDIEAATIRGWRWWSIEDLRSTQDEVFPEDLADRLERLLAG